MQEAKRIYEDLLSPPAGPSAGDDGLRRPLRNAWRFSDGARALPQGARARHGLGPGARRSRDIREVLRRIRRRPPRSCRFLRQPGLRPTNMSASATRPAASPRMPATTTRRSRRFAEAKRFAGARFDIAAHREGLRDAQERRSTRPSSTSAKTTATRARGRSSSSACRDRERRSPSRSLRGIREVAAAGELPDINRIASSLGLSRDRCGGVREAAGQARAEGSEGARPRLPFGPRSRLGRRLLRVTDKMPHNFQHLGLIALLFPNARIIHCRRDPLDTCVSCFTTQLRANVHGYAGDLGTLGVVLPRICRPDGITGARCCRCRSTSSTTSA